VSLQEVQALGSSIFPRLHVAYLSLPPGIFPWSLDLYFPRRCSLLPCCYSKLVPVWWHRCATDLTLLEPGMGRCLPHSSFCSLHPKNTRLWILCYQMLSLTFSPCCRHLQTPDSSTPLHFLKTLTFCHSSLPHTCNFVISNNFISRIWSILLFKPPLIFALES
jgi:hypothetical protein